MKDNVQRRDWSVEIKWHVHSIGKKMYVFLPGNILLTEMFRCWGRRKAEKNMLHISSSNLNKNNTDDQKVFSLSGLVFTEHSSFILGFLKH